MDTAYSLSKECLPKLILSSIPKRKLFGGKTFKFFEYIQDLDEVARFQEGIGRVAGFLQVLKENGIDLSKSGYDDLDRAATNISRRLGICVFFLSEKNRNVLDRIRALPRTGECEFVRLALESTTQDRCVFLILET